MDALLLYILKVNGLLILFFILYKVLFEKLTFYVANRFYFISILIISWLVPSFFFIRVIKIIPLVSEIDGLNQLDVYNTEITYDNLFFYLLIGSSIVTIVLILKFLIVFITINSLAGKHSITTKDIIQYYDHEEIKAPFSFWNSIYYNSKNYSVSELEVILLHEEVHVKQKHTIDIVLVQLICCLFWFNPWVWKIKKCMVQNLEFLADQDVLLQKADKVLYQKTLLKTMGIDLTTDLTHPFNQSFLKTRIMKINQAKSNKMEFWRYSLPFCSLIVFMLLFQIRTVAQEVSSIPLNNSNVSSIAEDLSPSQIRVETKNKESRVETIRSEDQVAVESTDIHYESIQEKDREIILKKRGSVLKDREEALKERKKIWAKLDDVKKARKSAFKGMEIAMKEKQNALDTKLDDMKRAREVALKDMEIANQAREIALKERQNALDTKLGDLKRVREVALKDMEIANKTRVLALKERQSVLDTKLDDMKRVRESALKNMELANKSRMVALKEKQLALKAKIEVDKN